MNHERKSRSAGNSAASAAVYSAPSRIDGTGAFAAVPLPRRRKIGELDGSRIPVRAARQLARTRRRIHIVELDQRHALDASAGRSPLKYVNHSCRPNTYFRIAHGRVEFYALVDIAPGQELTARYGPTHHDGRLRCRCGVPGCAAYL